MEVVVCGRPDWDLRAAVGLPLGRGWGQQEQVRWLGGCRAGSTPPPPATSPDTVPQVLPCALGAPPHPFPKPHT